MKRFIKIILMAAVAFGTFPAMAAEPNWSGDILATSDLTRNEISGRNPAAYYRFDTNVNSNPLYIKAGYRVRITLNDDTGQPVRGSNAATCQILYLNHTDGTTWSINDASPLLGMTLDGVASTGGVTNDTIWDVEGPIWIVVDPTALPAAREAYVSVISMRSTR